MNGNWTVEDMAAAMAGNPDLAKANKTLSPEGGKPAVPQSPLVKGGTRKGYNKYRVAPKEDRTYNGVVYHSKREAKFAQQLDMRKSAGEISFWIRQVPFLLPGGTEYRLDFITFVQVFDTLDDNNNPEWIWHIEFYECKGRKIRLGEIKRKQTEEIFEIHIEVV